MNEMDANRSILTINPYDFDGVDPHGRTLYGALDDFLPEELNLLQNVANEAKIKMRFYSSTELKLQFVPYTSMDSQIVHRIIYPNLIVRPHEQILFVFDVQDQKKETEQFQLFYDLIAESPLGDREVLREREYMQTVDKVRKIFPDERMVQSDPESFRHVVGGLGIPKDVAYDMRIFAMGLWPDNLPVGVTDVDEYADQLWTANKDFFSNIKTARIIKINGLIRRQEFPKYEYDRYRISDRSSWLSPVYRAGDDIDVRPELYLPSDLPRYIGKAVSVSYYYDYEYRHKPSVPVLAALTGRCKVGSEIFLEFSVITKLKGMKSSIFHIPEQLVISIGDVEDQKNLADYIHQPQNQREAVSMSRVQRIDEGQLRLDVIWNESVINQIRASS